MRPIDADALIEKCGDWYVEEGTESGFIGTLKNLLATEPIIQPIATDTNVGDKISKFIDGLEEIFADLRERHVDDSVCGLCEYDGAYMGQSGDWCNECPGFDRDDCFKLSDETRKKWTDEIIKALPTIQPEPQEGHWINGKCDLCGEHAPFWCMASTYHESNFCPNCGAKMTISTK